jgi:ABC-2 type transport system permease protein
VVVLVLAEVLRLPGWMRALSPFDHLALVPAADFDPVAFLGLLALATLLAAGGCFTFVRRDIG